MVLCLTRLHNYPAVLKYPVVQPALIVWHISLRQASSKIPRAWWWRKHGRQNTGLKPWSSLQPGNDKNGPQLQYYSTLLWLHAFCSKNMIVNHFGSIALTNNKEYKNSMTCNPCWKLLLYVSSPTLSWKSTSLCPRISAFAFVPNSTLLPDFGLCFEERDLSMVIWQDEP